MSRLLGASVLLAMLAVMTWAAQAVFVPDSTSLTFESCPNGYFDPGETNTVTFVIKNDTDNDLTEVQVELLADGSVWNDGSKDRKSTRLNSSHMSISYAVFCLKKKKNNK